jgi:hypothetical protein
MPRVPRIPRSPQARRLLVAVTCAVGLLAAGLPAQAAAEPSDELHSQRARVSKLQQDLDAKSEGVDRARTAVETASLAASDALERYTAAIRRLEASHATEDTRQDRLLRAQRRLDSERANLGRWARTAYRGGGSMSEGLTVATMLRAGATDELGSTMVTLRRVGHSRGRVLESVKQAERAQQAAAEAAAEAAREAESAAVAATEARKAADAAVAEQRTALARSESELAQAQDAVAAAEQRQRLLTAAALAAAAARREADNRVTGTVGSCAGGSVDQYANGHIPLAALCPLWGTPGHYLRADAAHAFDQLSRAYAARFATPVCVTDSYRTFAEQVRLRAAKPGLAAVPGTSNHGWGTATDLCGGIQGFGTAQHAWMVANAPLYGWFHPSWARQGGSKPEPWHWEYAG